jgi:hypothetical protein
MSEFNAATATEAELKAMFNRTPVVMHARIGSWQIQHPQITPKDKDYLVLIPWNKSLLSMVTLLREEGWELCGKDEYNPEEDCFLALRKGEFNLIVTNDSAWYNLSLAAQKVCEHLRLHNKEDRVFVFETVRDDYYYTI